MTGQLGLERVRDWQRFCHRQVGSRHAMPASQDLMQRDDLICITDGFVLFSGLELAS